MGTMGTISKFEYWWHIVLRTNLFARKHEVQKLTMIKMLQLYYQCVGNSDSEYSDKIQGDQQKFDEPLPDIDT